MIQKILSGVFKFPVVRHVLAALLIMFALWGFFISPLQESNAILKDVIEKEHNLVVDLSGKDTYKVENHVNGAKIKKGGEIKLTPDTDLKVSNVKVQVSKDSIKEKERTWFGRQFQKIGNLFKKKK